MSYETLEVAVQALTTTNAALVNAVTGTQQEASSAIAIAEASALAAGNSEAAAQASAVLADQKALEAGNKASAANTSAGIAATKASEAKSSAETAVAVTTGGTASLTPAAGKIPIANNKGEIPIEWLGPDVVARIMMASTKVNDIGIPGTIGFGVGICPVIPAGYSALSGTFTLNPTDYGNYQYSDGSVVCWIPAHYERHGHVDNPTYAQHGVNSVDIKPISAFASRAAAKAAGYSLPRAFIDGGEVMPGFMHDKYRASNNGGIASSLKNGKPLTASATHNPFSGLNGSPSNTFGGAWAAAKTRGTQFFPASRFMRSCLATLALAHAQAAKSTASCAWFDPAGVTSFPKGNNNNAFGDFNDPTVLYTHDGFADGNCGLTGSGVPFAKTTHNGQANGVADLNGNVYTIEPGLTCVATSKAITAATKTNPVALTVVGHGLVTGAQALVESVAGMTQINTRIFTVTVIDADTVTLDGVDGAAFGAYTSGGSLISGQFYVAKESVRMQDFTGGATLATDHFGATGVAAMMQPIAIPMRTDYPNNGVAQRYGNGANQVLDPATDGDGYLLRGLGFPKEEGASVAGSSLFGQDYFYQYIRNELCLFSGIYWSAGAVAGPWAVSLSGNRTYANTSTGFCAASYPVLPSGSEG